MEKEDIKIRQDVIKNTFDNHYETEFIEEYHTGDLFKTQNNEYILLDLYTEKEFGIDALTQYITIAEELNNKYHQKINIYIVSFNDVNVTVSETQIPSKADFTIRFAINKEADMCRAIYDAILEKYESSIPLTTNDIDALSRLHLISDEEDKQFYLKEYLRIVTELDTKR